MVVDGEEGKPYDGILRGSRIFSPDSKHLAYGASEKGGWFLVVDGEEGDRYERIGVNPSIFSPNDPDSIHYFALLGGNMYIVEERIK